MLSDQLKQLCNYNCNFDNTKYFRVEDYCLLSDYTPISDSYQLLERNPSKIESYAVLVDKTINDPTSNILATNIHLMHDKQITASNIAFFRDEFWSIDASIDMGERLEVSSHWFGTISTILDNSANWDERYKILEYANVSIKNKKYIWLITSRRIV